MGDIKYLADTNIIIDYIKGITKVKLFVDAHRHDLVIPYITFGEVIQGVRNNRELREVSRFLTTFDFYAGSSEISRSAIDIVKTHVLKNGLGFFDALLASMAIINDYVLVTHNLKHFKAINGLKVMDVITK